MGKKQTPWAAPRIKPEDAGIMSAEPPARSVTAEPIFIYLPKPLSVNELYLNNKGKRGKGRIPTPKYREWIAEAVYDCRKQVFGRIEGKYWLEIKVPRAISKADIWNLEKGISDLLQKEKIITNDRLCEGGSIRWSDDLDRTCVVLRAA